MSPLFKGMEMPPNCMLCNFCVEEADPADGEMCMVTGSLMPPCTMERLDNCPLFPVPPHGDLIDRKAAYDSILDGMVMTGYQSRALDCINEFYVPTIIPASEEGE